MWKIRTQKGNYKNRDLHCSPLRVMFTKFQLCFTIFDKNNAWGVNNTFMQNPTWRRDYKYDFQLGQNTRTSRTKISTSGQVGWRLDWIQAELNIILNLAHHPFFNCICVISMWFLHPFILLIPQALDGGWFVFV